LVNYCIYPLAFKLNVRPKSFSFLSVEGMRISQSLGRAVVLIDNGYLSAILRDEFKETRIDYLKLSEVICKGYSRLRTYIYDCLPYQANPPTQEQQELYAGKVKFFNALSKLPSFEPRFGKQRPRAGGFVQKGVDVLLAVDLVRLSSKGQIQKAFLIAGDGDYVPAVKAAKDDGVSVKLYHSGVFQTTLDGHTIPKYSNELWQVCDEREIISDSLIKQCAF
jgi:uncharacterized LabA/DUF88 family protein